ncbi:protein sneaky [Parasteatoda tepidariorum]|uniref:protein sneaky n=1 Tax=Parasteatoda tepidariorum TaxID=114398 RepID=UPI0039BD4E44
MFGFPIGLIFGYILQKIIIERLRLNPFSTRISGMILMLWMGIGYAISTQVRCICFLTIPSLCGKTGRAYINTFILTMIITGPLENIISNAKESTRVISCIASLNYNHTVKRFKLMFKPVKEIVWDLVGAGDKLKDGTKGFEGAYKEIEEEQWYSFLELNSKKKKGKNKVYSLFTIIIFSSFSFLSLGIFTKGVKACYKSFGAAYDRCHSYLPVIGYLLCWPMKLTFICDIAGAFMGKRACDSKDALSPGFGESMDTADEVQKEFDKEFGVQVHYKLDIPPEKVDQITPQDIGHSLKYQFEKKKRTLEFFLNLATRILTFTFIFVFQTSRKYCDQYLRNIEFDNRYITSYFRHIDERRKAQDKVTLLPLKKGEKIELVEPFRVRISKDEKAKLLMNSILLVGELLTASIILTFDWIFCEFLMLIQRHSQITYYQTGVHHIKMTVFGDGFVGTMVRSVLKGFDKKHKIDEFTTTAECLPRASKLHSNSIIILYSTFLLIFALMFIETYALRLRRAICRFFFPKREKKRILFLYNDWLKKRNAYMRFMRHRVRKRARDQALALDSGVFLSLRLLYPRYFGWLGKLGFGKKKCLVCEEVESRKRPFIVCSKECPFCYCPECWKDMQGKCYVCLPDDDEDSPLSDEDFDDEDA